MIYIVLLFLLQTAILIGRYYFDYPVEFGFDLDKLVSSFYITRGYQIINLLFLGAFWFHQRKRLAIMFSFLKRRGNWISIPILFIYIGLVIVFLEPFTTDVLYRNGYIIVVVGIMYGFPFLFPKDLIANPVGFNESDLSFELYGTLGQTLPVNHPEMGVFILGAAGSGKTKSVVEPIILQMVRKRYSGLLYDYDFSSVSQGSNFSLSQLAYNAIEKSNVKTRFFSINFQDLSTSSRINPITPVLIKDRTKLSSCLRTLLLNLSPQMFQKEDFWNNSGYVLLKGIIVFLNNKYPSCCTLPHAIMLGLQPASRLISALQSDEEAAMYASSIIDAYKIADEQFVGILAAFKILLERLIDKNVFWVLSGDEVPLVVNDIDAPSIVCLGNTPTEKATLSPIISMVFSTLISQMYNHGRNKSFIMIDELPTLILPQLSEVPATGRKYKISTVVALQNMAQLEKAYSQVGAREIQDSFSNHFIGRGPFTSSKELSDMFGKEEKEHISRTKSDKQESKTISQKEDLIITPQAAMSLKTGEFMGRVVHGQGGVFKMKLKPLDAYGIDTFNPLPRINEQVDIEGNYIRIQREIEEIVTMYSSK